MDEVMLGGLLASTLRVSTPLILCALAGLLSERSGVIDLGLEGKMLLAAFAAGAAGAVTGSLPLALLAALGVGVALSMLHGYACVSHTGDQVVMGMALSMIAAGLSIVLGIAWFKQGGQTPPLPDVVRLTPWFSGLAEPLAGLPGVGPILGGGLLGHNGLVYGALLLVPAVWWALYRTRLGLRLRATGDNPAMVDAAGLSVKGLRYGALAAMIFGKWHPVTALWACLLFGFLDAVAIRLQGVLLPAALGGGAVPVQAIQALPYVMTVVLLAGFVGRSRAPAALGIPYVKER